MINVCDRLTDEIVAYFQEEVMEAVHAEDLEYVETFDATIQITDKSDYLEQRNRVVIRADDGIGFKEFIIDEIDGDRYQRTIRCTSSYLDLDKQKIIYPESRPGQTIEAVAGFILEETEWELGTIDYHTARSLSFDNHMGAFQALKVVAEEFDRELNFRVEISGNKIVGRYVDILEERGEYRGKEIVFGKDLIGLRRLENSENTITALLILGPQNSKGTRITTAVYDSDAFERWSRNGQHLWDVFEPQTNDTKITADELKELGASELKKRVNAAVQYQITQVALESIEGFEHEKVLLGDTQRIKDEGYSPPLYVEARAISVTRNLLDPSDKDITLGEFVEYTEREATARFRQLIKMYGYQVIRSNTAPKGQDNVIWMDTSKVPNVAYTWDGDTWEPATPTTAAEVGAETPAGAQQKADTAEQNANDYTDNQLVNFVEKTVYQSDLSTIQNQIDKSITSWFFSYAPTLSNAPASDWKTTGDKNVHLGDLFYNTQNGQTFRFMQETNGTYSWTRIVDNDITAALEAAKNAVDTADSKRRVFVAQPVPPYDVGDLWTNGQSIYRAVTVKKEGETINSSDWVKAGDVTSQNTAADTSKVNGVPSTTIATAVQNFNTRNDRIATVPANPIIVINGEAIDHVINSDGSADISFEWTFSGTGDAYDIDGFLVFVYASTSSSAYTFGADVNGEILMNVTYDKRGIILPGVAANKYYTFGVQAYRIVDDDIHAAGILKSAIVKSAVPGENPYLPSTSIAFSGDIQGTINGTTATTITNAVEAFGERNDRNATLPATPTLNTSGSAVDHTINTDGSADISFEWIFNATGAAGNIDGFLVYVRQSSSSAAYTFGTTPAEETVYTLAADQRAMIFYGLAANKYYTLGVQAFRNVDQDINANGILKSAIAKSTVSGENPYRPSSSVPFNGTIGSSVSVPAGQLTGAINPEKNTIAGATSRVVWDSSGITVTDDTGQSATTINKNGINVKNGAFTLQDDISSQGYSIVAKKNLIKDHSFELLYGTASTYDPVYLYMNYTERRGTSYHWYAEGTPKLAGPYATDTLHYSPFGEKCMMVNNSNKIIQSLTGLQGGQTYTVSAFFKKHADFAPGTPRFYIRNYEEVTPQEIWSVTKTFEPVPTYQELVRYAFTFQLLPDYIDMQGVTLDIIINSANSNWILVDGVQLVEGELPVVYDTEDAVWMLAKGRLKPSAIEFFPNSFYSSGEGLNMNNSDIYNVNHLLFNDPGSDEGIEFAGGNGWQIYESPNNLSNGAGNLQFVSNGKRILTIDVNGSLDVLGSLDMENNNIEKVNKLTFNDAGSNEGLEWLGGAGWKIYESPDDLSNAAGNLQFVTGSTRRATITTGGNMYIAGDRFYILNTNGFFLADKEAILKSFLHSESNLVCGSDSSGARLYSMGIYNRTYSSGATVTITSSGTLGRISSARKSKLAIEDAEMEMAEKLLLLQPRKWFDRGVSEHYSNLLTREANGEKIDWKQEDHFYLERVYGLIAEEVEAAGLSQFVIYTLPNEEGKKEAEGLMYERIWVLLIPIVRKHEEKVNQLEKTIQKQGEQIEFLQKQVELLLDTIKEK